MGPNLVDSGVDKAAYCVCTRKFSASTLENLSWWCTKKTFKISGTHHFVKVMCTRTVWSMVFIYRITNLSCGTLVNFATQNKASDSIDKKRCHRFEVEESLLELLRRMKRLRVWIKNCIFHDRFSFMKPTTKWARSQYYRFLRAKGKARFPKQLLTSFEK